MRLNAKVTLTLTAVFAVSVGAFLVFLVPFLGEQRATLLDKDQRLLSTLRDNYARDLIYDLLSENEDSLAIHLADLAGQRGLLWARVEADGIDLAATADDPTIRELLGEEATRFEGEPGLVLLLRRDGRADLVSTGGRPLLSTRAVRGEALPARKGALPPRERPFEEVSWNGRTALSLAAELQAAGEPFGRLYLLYSLAELQRSQALTHTLFYGLAGTSFVLLLLLLNLLIARIVIAPLRNVQRAMSRAATGDLEARLPLHSRDELGAMADAFNRMVGELFASKREVEDYSRNLEAMVAARTQALQQSEAALLDVKNRLATVIANVATGVISLDEQGRIETFNERAAEILAVSGDVRGRRLDEVLEGDPRRIVDLVEAVRRGRAPREEAQLVCQLPRGRRTLSVVASALPGDGGGQGTVVVCEDLTQILATQRLEAWKEAVERVIHEIKNPLTPVGLAAETLKSAHANEPGEVPPERARPLRPRSLRAGGPRRALGAAGPGRGPAGRRGRPRPIAAGAPERGQQRARSDGGTGGRAAGGHRRRGAGSPDHGGGPGSGGGRRGADLRAPLHDQGEGDGARPRHRPADRRGAPRADHGGEPDRPWDDGPDPAARG